MEMAPRSEAGRGPRAPHFRVVNVICDGSFDPLPTPPWIEANDFPDVSNFDDLSNCLVS